GLTGAYGRGYRHGQQWWRLRTCECRASPRNRGALATVDGRRATTGCPVSRHWRFSGLPPLRSGCRKPSGPAMNRRSFLTGLAPAALATAFLNDRHSWAADVQRAPLTVTDIADRIFVISGGGGNVTVFNSSDGVLLVDGGSPERSDEILKLIRQRTGS